MRKKGNVIFLNRGEVSVASVAIDKNPKAEANRVLREFDEDLDLPVPVVAICRKLGIEVLKTEFTEPSLSGVVVNKDGRFCIYVNRHHGMGRRRFTIAHELGHALLHLQDGQGLRDTGRTVAYRREAPSDMPVQEREANVFAANLLMPEPFVRAYQQWGLGVDQLAKKFAVSEQAMEVRLNELGLE